MATSVTEERARTIVSRNDSPDIAFAQSVNPYRGCEHGCVYCYARPTHAYLGLSPGLDFETRLFAKPDAARLLERELARPGYRCQPIMLGANTDAYQPIERARKITRAVLKTLARHRHPAMIVTKSAMVARDLDLLSAMAARSLVQVAVSVTTLDAKLAREMEPRASTPRRRLAAITALRSAGVPVAVMAAPIIPGLNDHELEDILAAAHAAGARSAAYTLLRLPHELRELFDDWLALYRPDRRARVLSLIRQCRGGGLNASGFTTRMRGEGPVAELLARRFAIACDRQGLDRAMGSLSRLDVTQFIPPAGPGAQLSLF